MEDEVLAWFNVLSNALGQHDLHRYAAAGLKLMADYEALRKGDIILVRAGVTLGSDGRCSWRDAMILRELKSYVQEDLSSAAYMSLASGVREIFGVQPGCRFVHGFTICGHRMRCWLLDHGGASVSCAFTEQ